jgi:ZU5 domain
MVTSLRRAGALAALSLTLFAACSNEPTNVPSSPLAVAPTAAPSADLLGGLTGLVNKLLSVVVGVQRNTPLASSITVTQTIGSAGGSISIPEAGVTVTVPSGALASSTVITMTARAGSLLAYDFAPHGVTFAKPLVFTQSLSGTNASLLTAPLLQLGYYSDPSLLTAVGGLVSELLSGNVNLLSWTFTSKIPHFSGYIVAVGRGGASE